MLKQNYSKAAVLVIAMVTLIVVLLSSLPTFWNEAIDDFFTIVQFKIRGERRLSDDFVVIFIDSQDIRELGGWPITRDYYGYMIHILNQAGARVIGFDILFNTANSKYPEYDTALAEFIQASGNIVLPMAFAEIERTPVPSSIASQKILQARQPSFPLELFRQPSAAIGFSNFDEQMVYLKVPLCVIHNDSILFSFGFELARTYLGVGEKDVVFMPQKIQIQKENGATINIPVDERGRMRLNHFDTEGNLSAISFVQLLQEFQNDTLTIDLKDKCVVIAATAPGICQTKATPFAAALPATFLHLTAAENIISNNFLKQPPFILHVVIIVFFPFLIFVSLVSGLQKKKIFWPFATLAAYLFLMAIAFKIANFLLPVFYPLVSFFAAFLSLFILQVQHEKIQGVSQRASLNMQIRHKQDQLEEAEAQLHQMHESLNREIDDKRSLSDEKTQVVNDMKKELLHLQKQLSDLRRYAVMDKDMPDTSFSEIIHANNSPMAEVLALVDKIAANNIPVLLCGETGTGKELIARAIHKNSSRASKPFVAVNCGALSETLLESELFGHEKGSFTGALAQRKGRFELAHGGTLFLDEITETSPAFQAKLLRVLQEGTFERLGGEKTIRVDVHSIAASSKNLKSEVDKGTFREDLYYRLNGFPISLPALRERTDDIPLLARHFLIKHSSRAVSGFSDRAMAALKAYGWPGNVRELENTIRRAALLAQSESRELVQVQDLPKELQGADVGVKTEVAYQTLDEQILETLRLFKFSHASISKTARALGNRDRGTITEYFRGICFEHLVKADYDIEAAARSIAGRDDDDLQSNISSKIREYLKKLDPLLAGVDSIDEKARPAFQGLPKKYHPYLRSVMSHLVENRNSLTH
jgi:transcriptional regulator with GAF, ATPase, and Fis domain/CHASE2 domain-containing sensor protein